MKNFYLIIIISICFISCHAVTVNFRPKLKGDLYYKWLKLGSFYGRHDSLVVQYREMRDSFEISEICNGNSYISQHLETLEQYDLLESPYIYLKNDLDSVLVVFMTEKDYKSMIVYSYDNLIDKNRKVHVKLLYRHLGYDLYMCEKLISAKLKIGKTGETSSKMKFEDYR